jgi:hypothetical protein
MKVTASRLLIAAICVCAVAFVSSGLLSHATHGLAYTLGGVAWFAFLISGLAVMALAVTVIIGSARRRRASSAR